MSAFFKTVFAVVFSFLCSFTATVYDTPVDPVNGGDPFVAEDGENCYYTFTTGGEIDIFRVDSFENMTVMEQKTVFWAGQNGTAGEVWAPEIHKIGEKWYIIAAARFNTEAVPRGAMPLEAADEEHADCYRYGFVLESKTDDIFGEYEFKGLLAPNGLNNIDGTYLQKDGKLYYICSAYAGVAHQQIYICEMENPYTLKTDAEGNHNAVCLSKPQFEWEKEGWFVNEGPAVLYKNNSVYLVYSASGYSSGGYCMGLLTLAGDDVMNACNWQKSLLPVYSNRPFASIYNAGHCSFLYRADGSVWMIYHATPEKDFFAGPRLTYRKPIRFLGNMPIF